MDYTQRISYASEPHGNIALEILRDRGERDPARTLGGYLLQFAAAVAAANQEQALTSLIERFRAAGFSPSAVYGMFVYVYLVFCDAGMKNEADGVFEFLDQLSGCCPPGLRITW